MKKLLKGIILFLVSSVAIAQATLPWHKVGTVRNAKGSYTPVVIMGGNQIREYANTPDGKKAGDFWLRVGNWTSLGSATKVLDITVARDTFIRTSGVSRGASGMYYAVLYTGDGYPTQGGYSPSWATSPDGYTWTWHGPIGIFGRNQSSAMNLVVDETRMDDYACMSWLDLAGGMRLMHAPMPCNTEQWTSDNTNMWPIANEQPQFVGGVKTPYAYHLMGTEWNTGYMRHVVSCDGITNWRVVEYTSVVAGNGVKGANLSYDPAMNTIHALASGTHWTIQESDWGC